MIKFSSGENGPNSSANVSRMSRQDICNTRIAMPGARFTPSCNFTKAISVTTYFIVKANFAPQRLCG